MDSQKFSLQESLARIAQARAESAIFQTGKSLPAVVVSVADYLVTVKINVLDIYNFPLLTVPIAASAYTKEPIQPGDSGILIACDASIASASGQGSVSDLTRPANLSSLIFQPIGSKSFTGYDPLTYYATGIKDVMLRNATHQLQLENENLAWISMIAQINALLITIANDINAAAATSAGLPPITLTPITANTNPVVPRV